MSKASELLIKADEVFALSNLDTLSVKDIEEALLLRLEKFGYTTIGVAAVIDDEDGIFVTFVDKEGDEVTVLFRVDPEEGPMASVVSEDDDQITIDLSTLDASTALYHNIEFVDLVNLNWLNKSTADILLAAGEVNEQKMVVSVGGRKIRLPVVTKKDSMTNNDKRILAKAKILSQNRAILVGDEEEENE